MRAWATITPVGRRGSCSGYGMCSGCPGMGSGMWIWMVLLGVLIVAAIAALIALTVFLVRRSGPRSPD